MAENIADQAAKSALTTASTGNQPAAKGAASDKTSKTTVAVGVTFDMAEARKFSLDVSATTEVTAELIAVPAPTKLTELLAARFKQDGSVSEGS